MPTNKLTRKNTTHYDGPYWIPQWQIYRDGVHIGTATKTGTQQDNYPWDWETLAVFPATSYVGHAGLLSEAMQAVDDYA